MFSGKNLKIAPTPQTRGGQITLGIVYEDGMRATCSGIRCRMCEFGVRHFQLFISCLWYQNILCVQRWELMLCCRSHSQAHAQQWNVYDIDVGRGVAADTAAAIGLYRLAAAKGIEVATAAVARLGGRA